MPNVINQQVRQEQASLENAKSPGEKTVMENGMNINPDLLELIKKNHDPLLKQGAFYIQLTNAGKDVLTGNQMSETFPVLPNGVRYPNIFGAELAYVKSQGAVVISMGKSAFDSAYKDGLAQFSAELAPYKDMPDSLAFFTSYGEKTINERVKGISTKYYGGFPYNGFINTLQLAELKGDVAYELGEQAAIRRVQGKLLNLPFGVTDKELETTLGEKTSKGYVLERKAVSSKDRATIEDCVLFDSGVENALVADKINVTAAEKVKARKLYIPLPNVPVTERDYHNPQHVVKFGADNVIGMRYRMNTQWGNELSFVTSKGIEIRPNQLTFDSFKKLYSYAVDAAHEEAVSKGRKPDEKKQEEIDNILLNDKNAIIEQKSMPRKSRSASSSLDSRIEAYNVFCEYRDFKKSHPNEMVLLRAGDFYELYGEDARKSGEVLGLTVTKRNNWFDMAGFPAHALEDYLPQLKDAGIKVAFLGENVNLDYTRHSTLAQRVSFRDALDDTIGFKHEDKIEFNIPLAQDVYVRSPKWKTFDDGASAAFVSGINVNYSHGINNITLVTDEGKEIRIDQISSKSLVNDLQPSAVNAAREWVSKTNVEELHQQYNQHNISMDQLKKPPVEQTNAVSGVREGQTTERAALGISGKNESLLDTFSRLYDEGVAGGMSPKFISNSIVASVVRGPKNHAWDFNEKDVKEIVMSLPSATGGRFKGLDFDEVMTLVNQYNKGFTVQQVWNSFCERHPDNAKRTNAQAELVEKKFPGQNLSNLFKDFVENFKQFNASSEFVFYSQLAEIKEQASDLKKDLNYAFAKGVSLGIEGRISADRIYEQLNKGASKWDVLKSVLKEDSKTDVLERKAVAKEKEEVNTSLKTTKSQRDSFRDAIVAVAGKNNHNALVVKLPDSLVVSNAKGNLEQIAEMQVLRGRITFTNGNGEKLQTLALSPSALERLQDNDVTKLVKAAVQKKEVHEKVEDSNKVKVATKEELEKFVSDVKAIMGKSKKAAIPGFGTQNGAVASLGNKGVTIESVHNWDDNISFTATVPGDDDKKKIYLHPKDIRPEFYSHLLTSVKEVYKPQLVTVNDQKVTAIRIFPSSNDKDKYLINANIDGQSQHPRFLRSEDVQAFKDNKVTPVDLFVKYYPTKVAKKLVLEKFNDMKLSDGRELTKFKIYKPDAGDAEKGKNNKQYYMYVEVNNKPLHRQPVSHDILDAYFDRTMSRSQLAEKVMGEQLHLKSAYEKYVLPDNVKSVRFSKNNEGNWTIQATLSDNSKTSEKKISGNDLYSYFHSKAVTQQQLAAKYLSAEFKEATDRPLKVERRQGLGIK